ncbi:MAG: hypothetical protein Q7S35_11135 [Candidatus Limnocylindrales bacterium]|nr:hypothetical protein [Candidatus Limnocylindrales bacterium]
MIEPIRLTFEVDCPVDHAFDVWTNRIAQWWPKDHTVSAEENLTVVLEGRPGGRIFERRISGAATRVEIEHRGWERLGDVGEHWRDRNRGGWATLLPHYIAAAALPPGP